MLPCFFPLGQVCVPDLSALVAIYMSWLLWYAKVIRQVWLVPECILWIQCSSVNTGI